MELSWQGRPGLDYLPSSPTLFNAGTLHEQLSSCFLLDSPPDSLEGVYEKYKDIALLSKFSGGIGIAWHRVRSEGSLIRSTNGLSNGIVPWLKTLDSSVAAVNQGGKRKGAACVYLETWHADIEAFLELRDNTGDDARRAHHLNVANWVPDLFMKRVEAGENWSLFDPKDVPEFPDVYGGEFDRAYAQAEAQGLARKTLPARDLYARMMRTLAQTGNGWMTFKDKSNRACNQTAQPGAVVHLSNLCTEIIEVSSQGETAVCNLGSINLGRHVGAAGFDFEKLAHTVEVAVRQLDSVIDLNFYPIATARASNLRWRPVGLGLMGLQDVFFRLRLPFDSEPARALSRQISEDVYFHTLRTSNELARLHGAHPNFADTRAARGELQFDAWGATPTNPERWRHLAREIEIHGLRNSLLIAIAPTATIASIAGCYECIEPPISNLFKRETLSGDFLQINGYLVDELKQLGLWTAGMRDAIKLADGSIQQLEAIPAELRDIYRTAWELPMKSLIEMAAARGAFIDQSQSLNLFIANPNIGQLSSMYMYAWKQGLKTTYYLRSRPATRIAKTTVAEPMPGAEPDSAATACSRKIPRFARPASDAPARSGVQPDAAADAVPEILRDVSGGHQEHLERRGNRFPDRFEPYPAPHESRGSALDRALGRVLRDRRFHRLEQPGLESLQAHQLAGSSHVSVAAAVRGSLARAVLPDVARQLCAGSGRPRPGIRGHRQQPFHPAQGGVLPALDGLRRRFAANRHRRRPSAVPAELDLLRELHRGPLLLRCVRVRVFPAFARPAARARGRHQLGVSR